MKKNRVSMREPKPAKPQGSNETTYTYPDGSKKSGPTITFR